VEGLQLTSEQRGDSVVVSIRGDLDVVTGREFDDYLARARRGHDHVVLDLSAVDFMDTSALAVIVGHWKELQAAGGTLTLAGARYRYTKSLWITGLADRLPLFDTVDLAVTARRAAAGSGDDAGAVAP
jgi:anti-sigma B factor antagonist